MSHPMLAHPQLPADLDLGTAPTVGIVLGSGIVVLQDLEERVDVPYDRIAGMPQTTVAGHAGVLTIGTLPGGPRVAIARGRFHLYEGHPLESATSLMRLYEAMGLEAVILTNAAGGLVGNWAPGDLMLITDHLNLMGPFQGAQPAFRLGHAPCHAYDPAWGERLMAWASQHPEVPLRRGVYAGLLGPNYETPAEIAWLQRIGAQAVGMSTVPEADYAASHGLRVLGVSCITNVATTAEAQATTSHGEVVDVAAKASRAMDLTLRAACALV